VTRELLLRVEAETVVGDLERHLLGDAREPQPHGLGLGMLDGVVQGFLGDAVQSLFHSDRSRRFIAEVGPDVDAVPDLECGGLLFQRCDYPFVLQRLRPELEDERAHLCHARLGQGEHVFEGFHDLGRAVVEFPSGGVGAQGYAVECLGDGVVQPAGQALALFERGLATCLGEQAGVLHGDGGLVGDGLEEGPLVLSGLLPGG
jgi:hypothetical protein